MDSRNLNKIIAVIVILAMSLSISSCAKSTQESVDVTVPFRTNSDTSDSASIGEMETFITEENATNQDIDIEYSDSYIVEDYQKTSAGIYKADFYYSFQENDSIRENYDGDWNTSFSYYWYLREDSNNGDFASVEVVNDFINSVEIVDKSEADNEDNVLSDSDEIFNSCIRFDMDDTRLYIVTKDIEGLPLTTAFGAAWSDVYGVEGIVDFSSFIPFADMTCLSQDKLLIYDGIDVDITEQLVDDSTIVPFEDIGDSIEKGIARCCTISRFDKATIFLVQLEYVPLVEYSVEDREHVGLNVDYGANGFTQGEAYLIPVWTVYFETSYANIPTGHMACFINALTGDPLYKEGYSIGDSIFDPDKAGRRWG